MYLYIGIPFSSKWCTCISVYNGSSIWEKTFNKLEHTLKIFKNYQKAQFREQHKSMKTTMEQWIKMPLFLHNQLEWISKVLHKKCIVAERRTQLIHDTNWDQENIILIST